MNTFPAKFRGFCTDCDDRIQVGDLVTYAENTLVHADCDALTTPPRPATTCTRCWLVQPCGCDDE